MNSCKIIPTRISRILEDNEIVSQCFVYSFRLLVYWRVAVSFLLFYLFVLILVCWFYKLYTYIGSFFSELLMCWIVYKLDVSTWSVKLLISSDVSSRLIASC